MKRYAALLSVVALSAALTGCVNNDTKEGVEYLEKGKYKEAVEQFEQAVEAGQNVGEAYRGIGMAKWEQKDYEGARDAFKHAIESKAEKTAAIYNLLGSCEMELDNPKGALSYYRLALSAEDADKGLIREVKFNMIAAFEQSGDWESARAKLKEYIAEYPDDEKAQKEAEFLETRQ